MQHVLHYQHYGSSEVNRKSENRQTQTELLAFGWSRSDETKWSFYKPWTNKEPLCPRPTMPAFIMKRREASSLILLHNLSVSSACLYNILDFSNQIL